MAERPSKLNDESLVEVEKKVEIIRTDAPPDEILLVDKSESAYPKSSTVNQPEISDDPNTIRANIEETRAEMSETIDAIQEKLSFDNISKQVKTEVSEYVSGTLESAKNTLYETVLTKTGEIMSYAEQGIREVADTEAVHTVRRNPTAFTLIGLGIAALLIRGSRQKKPNYRYDRYDDDRDERNYDRAYSSKNNKSTFAAAQDKISDAAGSISDSVGNVAGTVSESVGGAASAVAGTVSGAASAVAGTVSDAASGAYKQAGNLGSYAKDAAGTAQDQYEYYMEEHPLAVGAVAAALGVAIGFSIPSTDYENRLMGDARNNLVQKAQDSAREAVGKVQEVAGQVKETVQQEAKAQGLTS